MNYLSKIHYYMNLAGGWEITRRYFVNQGFDGILTIFGVLLGAFFIGIDDPNIVIFTSFGGMIAIVVSGFWIAFLTEEAENEHKKIEQERVILNNLDNTVISRAAKVSVLINSLVNGFSPLILGMIVISPFFIANSQLITINIAYTLSFGVILCLLFILGLFLGLNSKKGKLRFGINTLLAGVVVALVISFLRVF